MKIVKVLDLPWVDVDHVPVWNNIGSVVFEIDYVHSFAAGILSV